jgi:DNA gyrase subunit A
MLISNKGTLVRTRTDEISLQGRATQGVRLIKLKEGESLVGVERVEEPVEVDSTLAEENSDADTGSSTEGAEGSQEDVSPKENGGSDTEGSDDDN